MTMDRVIASSGNVFADLELANPDEELLKAKLVREIRALADSGLGVLFTTHDPNHALRAAHRAYLLRAGECLADGPVAEMLTGERLEALYRAPVQRLSDSVTGAAAFLPG